MTEEERRSRLLALGYDPNEYELVTPKEKAYEDMTGTGAFLTGAGQGVGGGIGGLGGAAMGGLGLAGYEEISATMKEEAEAKQGQLEDIEIIRRKIEEGNRLQALLEKLESMTTEQDAVKRIEHHIHENENTHEHVDHEGLEVKAGGT